MDLTLLRLFLLLMLHAYSDGEMAKLRGHFTKTSSTLEWKPWKAGKSLPHHVIPVNSHNPHYVWCRAAFNVIKIPGGIVENGTCAFAFRYSSSIVYAESYDLLISFRGSARVKSIFWDSFTAKPENSVLSPERVLIAVPNNSLSNYIAGNIGPEYSQRRAFYPKNGSIAKSESGMILVEEEPISYKLTNIKFHRKREKISLDPYILNSTQLFNLGSSTKLVSSIVKYIVPNIQYWGKPKGTLLALLSTIYVDEEDPIEVAWGIESTLKRMEFFPVNYELLPSSGVNVTIVGTVKTYEDSYDGLLTAIYEDGFSFSRPVTAKHIGKVVKRVIVHFSSPFFLNGSIIGTPERTELLYEKTTTTTTVTTTEPSTTLDTTTEMTPLLAENVNSTNKPKEVSSSKFQDVQTTNHITVETELPLHKHGLRNRELSFDDDNSPENEYSHVENKELRSTSDRIISVLSTIFTGLIFWYYSLGLVL